MMNPVGQMWDERFASVNTQFLYGLEPNEWIQQQLPPLAPQARVLALADGEGRNAVWLAQQGYQVANWDYSQVGLDKTQALARQKGVSVTTRCVDFIQESFDSYTHDDCFDALVASFFHVPKEHQIAVWQKAVQLLKPEAHLIVQVFAESQLGRTSGGPKDKALLYQTDIFATALSSQMKIVQLQETESLLNEGKLHQGLAKVINVHAIKFPE